MICLKTSFAGLSQNIDTICFPIPIAQKLYTAAEQKKVLEERVSILTDRIIGLQETISLLNQKDSTTVANYESRISIMKDQRGIFEAEIKSLETQLRKEKRKRRWLAIGSGAALTAFGYLYLTK